MSAAAFKVSMIGALGSLNGQRKMFPLTASDVNGEYMLFPSGSSEMVLNGVNDVYIVDMILSAAGTDCSNSDLYVNGMAEGTKLLHATSIGTIVNRPLSLAPIRIPKGVSIKWKQNT